jgi:hypothetical protein
MASRKDRESENHFGAIACFLDENNYTVSAIAGDYGTTFGLFMSGSTLTVIFRYAETHEKL